MSYLSVDRQTSSASLSKDGEEKEKTDDLEVDNSKSVLRKIATLYAEQLMSDLVLEVGGVGYPAHRLILCASSEVFQVMLMNRQWTEWGESRIILQETPTASSVFPHFLKYFYTGQIRISHQTVLPVLSLADKYNIKDLVSLCLCFMSSHVAQAARRGQLVAWMQYTAACGHYEVAKACQNYVKWNLEWIWAHEQFLELEGDALLQLLQQGDLVVCNEMTIYDFVVSWLERQRRRLAEEALGLSAAERDAHFEALLQDVFSHVRFPMMCPLQLAALLLRPLTQQHKDFFMERMAVAMSYQSGQYERIARLCQGQGGALFTPRLYCGDPWGSVLAVDRYHSLQCYHTRTFIFSTRTELADTKQDRLTEWTLDLYPKGVWFPKSLLIMWAGTFDVPEVVLRTVRISITCQNPPEAAEGCEPRDQPDIRVKIGILVWGEQHGVEHVSSVLQRVHRFSAHDRVLNIDGALDFDELNTPLYTPSSSETNQPPQKHAHCKPGCEVTDEPRHLLGPNRDQLRIQVVIMPLTDFCHLGPEAISA